MTTCESVRSMIASYVDGELSEEQAAPVRAHLLECPACRESVQEGKVIRRWFQSEPVRVPAGFATRVARRAFAGDPGLGAEVPAGVSGSPGRGALLPFVLMLTAVAAALLFAFSLLIQSRSLPEAHRMEAVETWFWEELPEDWGEEALPAEEEQPEAGTRRVEEDTE